MGHRRPDRRTSPALQAAKDARLGIFPALDTNPFLLFNLQSPNNSGALKKLQVRQAIEYAIDKVALGQIYGGPALNTPLDQVIPPGNVGYQPINLYPTPDHRGDPAKCKQMLAAAGYPNGLTLNDVYRNAGNHPAVAQSVQADLKKCGITVKLVPVNQADYYGKYLSSPDARAARRVGHRRAWLGAGLVRQQRPRHHRAAVRRPHLRAELGGLRRLQQPGGQRADRPGAGAAGPQDAAAPCWHQADLQIMKDAAIIPFQTQKTAIFRSSRVHNAIFLPFTQNYDVTQVWVR